MSCKKGYIKRKGSNKKGYLRKAYTRANGTRIKATYVKRSKMRAACTPDKGKPGKTPKSERVLPPLGTDIKLGRWGYKTKYTEGYRRRALRIAVKKHNPLSVLRHLNLARNYQSSAAAKAIMESDVKYMSRLYARYKKKHGMTRTKRTSRKRRSSKKRKVVRKKVKKRVSKRKSKAKRKVSKRKSSKKRKVSKRKSSKKRKVSKRKSKAKRKVSKRKSKAKRKVSKRKSSKKRSRRK